MNGIKFFAFFGAGVVAVLLIRVATVGHIWAPEPAVTAVVAANPGSMQMASLQTSTAPAASTPKPALPPVAEAVESTASSGADGGDGKTVIASDGKTVLPMDGKEALPPVGELAGHGPTSGDPANGGPPTEYLNKTESTPPPANQLLTPPNPVNVSGPLVSGEVPNPPPR